MPFLPVDTLGGGRVELLRQKDLTLHGGVDEGAEANCRVSCEF